MMSKITLFFFPFAGGSAYSYRPISELLSPEIKPVFVELPGRGARFNEPLLTSMDALAEDTLTKVIAEVDGPYAMFGHSMGSSLAYKICQKIQTLNAPIGLPEHLFVSAKSAPAVPFKYGEWHTYPSERLWKKLESLGGLPQEVLDSSELQSLIEPIVRADFEAESTNDYNGPAKLDIPMTVLGGLEDEISKMELMDWQLETSNQIDLFEFTGGHFYMFDHLAELAEIIMKQLCVKTHTL